MRVGAGTFAIRVAIIVIALPSLCFALPELDAADWQRILEGRRLVHEREQLIDGQLRIGGSAWQRVEAPVDVVWEVVVCPHHYQYLLPNVAELRMHGDELWIRHGVPGRDASYALRFRRDDSTRTLTFWVPRASGSLKAGSGALHVEPLDASSSLVAWTIMAEPQLGLMARMFRRAIQRTMLQVPTRIRDYVRRQQHATEAASTVCRDRL